MCDDFKLAYTSDSMLNALFYRHLQFEGFSFFSDAYNFSIFVVSMGLVK